MVIAKPLPLTTTRHPYKSNPQKPALSRLSGVFLPIPTRQMKAVSKLFCIEDLALFSSICRQLSISYMVFDFLLSFG